jgi:hypothetical protein
VPFILRALLEKRRRFEGIARNIGETALFAEEPLARGYLRPNDGYPLLERREELRERLLAAIHANGSWLKRPLRPQRATSRLEAHVR